jgi:amino acid transporter
VGVLIIPIVLTFAQLASYFRDSGGPVLYTARAFGPAVGFGTGWIYYVSRITAYAANSTLLATYVGTFWEPAATEVGRSVIITLVCAALTWANYVGVKNGVRALSLLTVLKLTPVLVLVLWGLPYVSTETVVPVDGPAVDDLGGTILLMMYAFVGFESATIVSGESTDPRRSLPMALALTTVLVGVFYFLVVLSYVAVLPNLEGDQVTLVGMGAYLFGPIGAVVITLAAVFSIGGNLGAILLAAPRLTFSMAEQHMLPRWFGAVHPKYSTPGNSIVFLGALALALALSGTFVELVVASSLTRLITYVLCIAALPIIHRRASDEEKAQAFRLPGGYAIPVIALLISLWIASHSGVDEWLLTSGLLGLGLALYGAARWARRDGVAS